MKNCEYGQGRYYSLPNRIQKEFNYLSDLSPEDRQELKELAAEDPLKDTVSFEDYKEDMKEWLSKL